MFYRTDPALPLETWFMVLCSWVLSVCNNTFSFLKVAKLCSLQKAFSEDKELVSGLNHTGSRLMQGFLRWDADCAPGTGALTLLSVIITVCWKITTSCADALMSTYILAIRMQNQHACLVSIFLKGFTTSNPQKICNSPTLVECLDQHIISPCTNNTSYHKLSYVIKHIYFVPRCQPYYGSMRNV